MVETDGTRDAGRRLPIACRVETGSREQPSERNWLVWTVVVYGAVAGVLAWGRWVAPLKADALTEPVWQGSSSSPFHGGLWLLALTCWSVACIAALIGAFVLRANGRWSESAFLFGAAGISGLFLADDVWQLHKPVLPDWSGLPSGVVLAGYVALVICWLVAFRVEIRRADVEILAIALAFFAAWAVCKTLPPFRAQSSDRDRVEAGGGRRLGALRHEDEHRAQPAADGLNGGRYLLGWGVTRRYGFSASHPFGNFVFASSSLTAATMITSSPSVQSTGVATW